MSRKEFSPVEKFVYYVGDGVTNLAETKSYAGWIVDGFLIERQRKKNREAYGGNIHEFATHAAQKLDPLPLRMRRRLQQVPGGQDLFDIVTIGAPVVLVKGALVVLALREKVVNGKSNQEDITTSKRRWPALS